MIPKRTVMLCINQIADGGAERVMSYLANDLSSHEYTVILVTSFVAKNEYGLSAQVIREVLDEKKTYISRGIRIATRIRELRRLCREYDPDVVISFMLAPIARSLIATKGLGVKNIVSIRSDPQVEFNGLLGKLILRCLIPDSDGFVFQTKYAKNFFSKSIQKKSCVIGNPVDEVFFNTKKDTINGRIVTVGRLSKEKNQGMLIKAFSIIHEEFPYTSLVIYGDGEQRESLQGEIDCLKISESACLAGQVKDVPNALSRADIFVLCSDTEGMPNALMEAMAMGIPCISTDCPIGGSRSLIENGRNGYLISVNDLEALVDKLRVLLTDRKKATTMGIFAKKCAESYLRPAIMRCWRQYIESFFEER